MTKVLVYLGLGANIGDCRKTLEQAILNLAATPQIWQVKTSRFYRTTPVSPLPQPDYVNAACSLLTTLGIHDLFDKLQSIEKSLGKVNKPKNAPRCIDIDLLHYGTMNYSDAVITVPHPEWSHRLFVITPLMDLTDTIDTPDKHATTGFVSLNLHDHLARLGNPHQETITLI